MWRRQPKSNWIWYFTSFVVHTTLCDFPSLWFWTVFHNYHTDYELLKHVVQVDVLWWMIFLVKHLKLWLNQYNWLMDSVSLLTSLVTGCLHSRCRSLEEKGFLVFSKCSRSGWLRWVENSSFNYPFLQEIFSLALSPIFQWAKNR